MRKLLMIALMVITCWLAADWARAAELRVPQNAVAGQPLNVATIGSGEATLYLVGPGQVIKRSVRLGDQVQIKGEELRSAGRWIAVIRGGSSEQSQVFWVQPGKAENLNFLARPSRVPVAKQGVISGVAFVFDQDQNLVLEPTQVTFTLSVAGAQAASHGHQQQRRGVGEELVGAQGRRGAVCGLSGRELRAARGAAGGF